MRCRASWVTPHRRRWLCRATSPSSGAWASLQHGNGQPLSSQGWALSVLTAPRPSSRRESGDLNSPLGQTLLCPQAQTLEEMPFHCSLGLRSSHFLCEDLPFPGHLTERSLIQFWRGTAAPPAGTARQGGHRRATAQQQPHSPYPCVEHITNPAPQHQGKLTFAQNIHIQDAGGCPRPRGHHVWALAAHRWFSQKKANLPQGWISVWTPPLDTGCLEP